MATFASLSLRSLVVLMQVSDQIFGSKNPQTDGVTLQFCITSFDKETLATMLAISGSILLKQMISSMSGYYIS
jgi:hypothetical protein